MYLLSTRTGGAVGILALVGATWGWAQTGRTQLPAAASLNPSQSLASNVLEPGDQFTLAEPNMDDLKDQSFQIGADGTVGLPLVGRVPAAGMKVSDFENALDQKLKRYIKAPRATITSIKYHGRTVSVIGAVNSPGAYQLTEPRSLLEVLSLAGGLKADAGSWLLLTRKDENGQIPASPNVDFSAGVSEAKIPLTPLFSGKDPSLNLTVLPSDVIMVAKADMVYAVGEVKKQGGFVLGENEHLSLLKLLSLAEGLQSTAAPAQARVIHESGGTRTEISVNVERILEGKQTDILMQPDDILFVPTSLPKKAAIRAIEAAIQAGTGIAIWRR